MYFFKSCSETAWVSFDESMKYRGLKHSSKMNIQLWVLVDKSHVYKCLLSWSCGPSYLILYKTLLKITVHCPILSPCDGSLDVLEALQSSLSRPVRETQTDNRLHRHQHGDKRQTERESYTSSLQEVTDLN